MSENNKLCYIWTTLQLINPNPDKGVNPPPTEIKNENTSLKFPDFFQLLFCMFFFQQKNDGTIHVYSDRFFHLLDLQLAVLALA